TIQALAFSPDGRYVASGSMDRTVKIWDVAQSAGSLRHTLQGHIDRVYGVAFTPDGKRIVSASYDNTLRLWHVSDGSLIREMTGHTDNVFCVATSPNGKWIASGSFDYTIRLWRADHAKTADKEIRFRAKVTSEAEVTQITASVNGVPVTWKRGMKRIQRDQDAVWFDERVTLDEGLNLLSIVARNTHAISQPVKVRVTYQPIRLDPTKPNLYLLAIGISDYQNDMYDLTFCDDDARAFANFFREQEGVLYGQVSGYWRIARRRTTACWKPSNGLSVSQATHKDIVMLFVAGHGVKDKRGNYYLFPHNGNLDRLRSTAVAWTEFTRTMEELPCKRALFMDTCHAGDVTGSPMLARRRNRAVDATQAVRELASDEVGCVVMASSMGRELAHEDDAWKHGAFTRALLEGFGKYRPFGATALPENADINKDGVVYLNELDAYVAERVKELTDGAQHPTTQKPSTVRSFPIAVVNRD
ncbi:MAG: caspase family protein, partial [Planctomycetota bacterium]|nr:caspase family protein [Planctomycetota bacterium]